ncbi:hypothetical protein JYT87_03990, partial [Nitrospira defluvii]|nr:hypothetical protein [Nitrospira defluvii]
MLLPALILFTIIISPALSAETLPPVSLSLAKAIEITLENNVDIQVERENIQLSRFLSSIEEAQFDPRIRIDTRTNRIIRSSTSGIDIFGSGTNRIVQENQQFNAGLNQRFRWGGDYDLTLGQSR